MSLPIIDISPLVLPEAKAKASVARRIARACEEVGFFNVCGHGIKAQLTERLNAAASAFFALPLAQNPGSKWRRRARRGADGFRCAVN